MATFGISAGEIILAIRLAQELYNKCFVDEPANVKYRRFLEHIQLLGNGLQKLNGTLEQNERQHPRREWHTGAQQNGAAPNLWSKLAGDFHKTLQECAVLLSRSGNIGEGPPKIAYNLQYWLQFEPEVDKLMIKLKFHSDQVETYCNPINMQMALRHAREIQQLRRQMATLERIIVHGVEESQKPWARILSPEIEARLELEFDRNCPPWSNDETKWPFREAFEAVAFYFDRGTVGFRPTPELGNTTSVMQHLNLAKACWILEKIRQSPGYRATGADSSHADTMIEFEDVIRVQLHRYERDEIQNPAEQELLELADVEFSIVTNQEEEPDLQDSCNAGILEEEILQIDLKPHSMNIKKSSLTVFRESNTEFRVMISTEQHQGSRVIQRYDNHPVTERHRVIPAYANPSSGLLLGHNLLIVNERGDIKRTIELTEAVDVEKLQQAFTGYRVHYSTPITRWCINSKNKTGNLGRGGMVQLWQYKPLPPITKSSASQTLNGPTSSGSPRSAVPSFELPMPSVGSGLELASILKGANADRTDNIGSPGLSNIRVEPASTQYESLSRTPQSNHRSRSGSKGTENTLPTISSKTSIPQSSVQSPTRGPTGDGVELLKPQVPALVIFTISGGRYSFLHLNLAGNIYVEPKSCGCRNKKKICDRIILQSTGKSFEIRELTADKEGSQGFESWDISVFRNPPSLEKWQKTTIQKDIHTLELKFLDENQKNVFLDALRELENLRTLNHNEYEMNLQKKRLRNAKVSVKYNTKAAPGAFPRRQAS